MPDNSWYQHFSEIVLLPDELKTLKHLQKGGSKKLNNNLKNKLQDYGLIEIRGTYSDYTCVLSDNGKRYLLFLKNRAKQLWLKNAWIPILVTIITNLIIDGVKWLLPLVSQWLSSSL